MLKPTADRERIIELLEHEGGVTEAAVRKVSIETGVPEADIWGTGKFYSLISTPGLRTRVCDGLTCQMFGADELAQQITQSGKEVERVSCLGQCDLAVATLSESMELKTFSENSTHISPDDSDLAINLAGAVDLSYSALAKAQEMGPEAVIEQLKIAGLQGRGGAGFPAHFKWTSVLGQSQTRAVRCLQCG